MDLYGEAGHYVGTALPLEPAVPLQTVGAVSSPQPQTCADNRSCLDVS